MGRKARYAPPTLGTRFNRLTLTGVVGNLPSGHVAWEAKCDCGNVKMYAALKVVSGHSKSCGCLKNDELIDRVRTHGDSHTGPFKWLYGVWVNMRARCDHPYADSFQYYGGRGITYCDEWRSYEPFKEWAVSHGYERGLTIDRIDNDGHYCPENCRWVSNQVQSANRRNSYDIEIDGVRGCLKFHAERFGVSYPMARARIKRLGWRPEDAVRTPKFGVRGSKDRLGARNAS